ncbi:hypothetical protein BEP19_06925 [Ammoniphilus oxalaticus]|uniref:Rqc2 homolog RqcH n=1 Tax=Ammoniphilus oxalaticus TaxID=66863 RepID=A0A419SJB3_9BACL|nr:NFACT RNA binding domain-containing protein [Ammoniphilus oxalaticus]RKD24134.1 hypothetical protein BEP19_06925 [Ammoniphilus oxalaticus]
MAFDGLVTRAVVEECHAALASGRISRIYQPSDTDIVLQIRANGKNKRLLLSANLTFPRIHLTTEEFTNPLEPPMFCMLLRKHCDGAIIESFEQPGLERVIHMNLRARDELGDWKQRKIIIEIMGRHSNIILLDVERNMILDGIHHVTPGMSSHRVVLPGRPYIEPPEQGKLNPLTSSKEDFIRSFDYNAGRLDRQIVDRFSGISPLVSREIIHRAGVSSRDSLWKAFEQLINQAKHHEYHPEIVLTKNRTSFSITRLSHLGESDIQSFESISECLEAFFAGRAERDSVRQKAADLFRFVSNELDKNRKKMVKLEDTRKQADEADRYRLYGELLTAHMHELKPGDKTANVINYYEEDTPPLTIPLDSLQTPAENAQAYFKRYNKAKNSIQAVEHQMNLAEQEIEYFDSIAQQLENASLDDIEEIREELMEGGYLRSRGRKQSRRKKPAKPTLEKYISSDGIEILVGKNNRQNDYLTNRLARSTDTWLHTKDLPGSHVVIRADEFSEQTLLEAATLAAYFSKARGSTQIPVDYTFVRHVRKPSGAKPGYVIYDNQKTIYVTGEATLTPERNSK